MGSRLSFITVMVVLLSCTAMRSWLYRPPPLPPTPVAPLSGPLLDDAGLPVTTWFDGRLIRALSITVGDFAARFNPYSEHPLSQCLSRPESHDAELVREETDRWIIYVRPRGERCLDGGERMRGADATYAIRKNDFSIIAAEFGE